MQRLLPLATLLVLAGVGWLLTKNFKLEGLDGVRVTSRDGTASVDRDGAPLPPANHDGPIRIATFNIQVFGDRKASKPHVMNVLADIVRKFDIVAIQEIRTKRGEYLMRDFVELINQGGKHHYDFIIGERLGRTSSKEQYAFVYDARGIEIDRQGAYTLSDPEDLLHREPLVAQFRVRGPPPKEAFTFTLINMNTDPDEAEAEVDALADVVRVVQQASGGEDDIILLGDLNVPGNRFDRRKFGRLGARPGIHIVIQDKPTNTRGDKMYDNILFDSPATVEFTGRGGVFDIHGTYDLTEEQTLNVSDHLPVWAEFTLYENDAVRGRVATRPGQRSRR